MGQIKGCSSSPRPIHNVASNECDWWATVHAPFGTIRWSADSEERLNINVNLGCPKPFVHISLPQSALVVKVCGITAWPIFYAMSTDVLFVNITSRDPHRTASNHIHRLTARMRWVLIIYTTFFLCKSLCGKKSKSLPFLSFFLSFVFERKFQYNYTFRSPIKVYTVTIGLKDEEAPKMYLYS